MIFTNIYTALIISISLFRGYADPPPRPGVGYRYEVNTTEFTPFDWNITLDDRLKIRRPAISQGIYQMTTNYTLQNARNYNVRFYKKDCRTLAVPTFPIVFDEASNINNLTYYGLDGSSKNDVQLFFIFNQTTVQESDIWTANKTGGYAEFCIRVETYLQEVDNPWAIGIHFHETTYKIEVDSLTQFNTTIDITRTEALFGGVDVIDYEEEILAYPCDDSFSLQVGVKYTQGDFVNICVETIESSSFEVNSIKDIVLSQIDPFNPFDPPTYESYKYIDNYVGSPLAYSACENSNTTDAVCRAKMQLIANFFDNANLGLSAGIVTVQGTVKLDYLGRRLSMEIPINLPLASSPSTDIRRNLLEAESGSFSVRFGIKPIDVEEATSGSFIIVTTIFPTVLSLIVGCLTFVLV